MKGMLVVNTKAYLEGTGQKAIRLAQTCRKLSGEFSTEIILAVQPSDIPGVSGQVTTFAQHIDAVKPGSHTGHILPEAVRAAGARGTVINHSERRLSLKDIRDSIIFSGKAGLRTVCCVPRAGMVRDVAVMKPECIAIEPPELIGTGIPVSSAKPSVISSSVRLAKKVNPRVRVLCGAGISSREDVEKAIELGASGVLVASGVVKARSQEKTLKDLLRGF